MTDHEKLDDGATRWLDRSGSVDIIFWILCLVCGVLFLADAFYVKHPHFEVEYLFGFYALFGFVFSVGLVLSAKELRRFLKRGEDYYD
jgi:hypothetical protein